MTSIDHRADYRDRDKFSKIRAGAMQLGAADIITKPFDPDDFIGRVRRCLSRR